MSSSIMLYQLHQVPHVPLALRQMEDSRAADAVESGEADVGSTASSLASDAREPSLAS
jgi:hypothetical protein